MRAVVFKDRSASLAIRPEPEPGPGEALLRVRLAGICNTDLELLAGCYGFQGVPGHEFVALVKSCPDRPDMEGRRVVADINCGCGACPRCLAGDSRHCASRTVIGIAGRDGAFADYLSAPAANLIPVPDGLRDQEAVFAEPLAAALEIGQQVHITARQKVLVLGDGKLGLLAALGLRTLNPRLVLAGHHPDKLAKAAAQGVVSRLVRGAQGLAEMIKEFGLFDLVVEATGREDGLTDALKCVRPEGVIAAKTTSRRPTRLDLARVVVNEVTILGSRCGDLALALDHLANKRLDVNPLIEAVYPFGRFADALEHARRPGALKVLLLMSE